MKRNSPQFPYTHTAASRFRWPPDGKRFILSGGDRTIGVIRPVNGQPAEVLEVARSRLRGDLPRRLPDSATTRLRHLPGARFWTVTRSVKTVAVTAGGLDFVSTVPLLCFSSYSDVSVVGCVRALIGTLLIPRDRSSVVVCSCAITGQHVVAGGDRRRQYIA